jgi:hypothetical protein
MDPVTGGLIKAGIGLLGGLFGKKKKDPTPRDNLLSQAQGAREAGEKYGFNPLTMLQYGQTAGAMGGGGSPPLASNQLILGAIEDVADVASGEAARRRSAQDLEMDLAQIKLDQLRGGVLAVAPSATSTVGSGPSVLGRRAATIMPKGYASGIAGAPAKLAYDNSGVVEVKKQALAQEYTANNGVTVAVPVGPDLDEVVTGVALEAAARVKGAVNSIKAGAAKLGPHGPNRPNPPPAVQANPWKRLLSRWPSGSPSFRNFP